MMFSKRKTLAWFSCEGRASGWGGGGGAITVKHALLLEPPTACSFSLEALFKKQKKTPVKTSKQGCFLWFFFCVFSF